MRFLQSWIQDRSLRFKLTMVLLILLACSMGIVFIPYYWGQESLKADLEKSFLELSNAIQVSVGQLTAPATSEEDQIGRASCRERV